MYTSIYEYKALANNGTEMDFGDYRGKALLIVNTASKCGFTPQYKGLETLYQSYREKGLVVIGFPCDQFAHQEPASDSEIAEFCSLRFGVTFPLMAKIFVNGSNTHPVFEFLKERARRVLGKRVKWNFTKFLVSPDGITVKRFAPTDEPDFLRADIEKILP